MSFFVVGRASRPRRIALALSLALLPLVGAWLAPASVAHTATEAWTATGSFLVGRPQSPQALCPLSTPADRCGPQHGVDLFVFPVPSSHGHHWFWLNGTANGPYDLDVYFYDAGNRELGSRSSSDVDETGRIPDGTSYALVTSIMGFEVSFEFVASRFE